MGDMVPEWVCWTIFAIKGLLLVGSEGLPGRQVHVLAAFDDVAFDKP